MVIYTKNRKKFDLSYNVYINQISYVLNSIGVNINTVPILDIRRNSSHNVIGDRAYSNNKNIVNKIGNITIDLFKNKKIGTVIKHIPGHGLSKEDTHFKLPIISDNLNYLKKNDFSVFKNKKTFLQ